MRQKHLPKTRCKACGGKIVIGHQAVKAPYIYHKNCLDSIVTGANTQRVDVSVSNHGSIILFAPLTDKAREWISDNVQTEGWMFFGGSLAVEPRFASGLAQGMKDGGLEVE